MNDKILELLSHNDRLNDLRHKLVINEINRSENLIATILILQSIILLSACVVSVFVEHVK